MVLPCVVMGTLSGPLLRIRQMWALFPECMHDMHGMLTADRKALSQGKSSQKGVDPRHTPTHSEQKGTRLH